MTSIKLTDTPPKSRRGTSLKPSEVSRIIELAKAGKRAVIIATTIGCSTPTVYEHLKRAGVSINRKSRKNHRKKPEAPKTPSRRLGFSEAAIAAYVRGKMA